jgi:glutamine cyclotransferase
MIRSRLIILAFVALFIGSCKDNGEETTTDDPQVSSAPPFLPFSVVGVLPHDTSYFTEGLEFHEGKLFESSGPGTDPNGTDVGPYPSAFGIVDSVTGKVQTKVELDKKKYFGEGITIFDGKIYQLTWKENVGFVYDAKTYKKLKEFTLPAPEGWGLTHDDKSLIMSAGTNQLYFLDPDSLTTRNILSVFDNNGPLTSRINELEYINGFIYANEWYTNYILKIDPANGKIVGRIDLTRQVNEARSKYANSNEMNGIAYDSASNNILVTGKNWPEIYKIRLQ